MPRRQDDSVPGYSADWRPHDTDRSIDPFDDGLRPARPPSSRPPVPSPARPAPPSRPGPSRVAGRGVAPRILLLTGGGVLAVVATVLVFLTDDPDLLRVAVVAAAWAFVLATFVAGRRSSQEIEAAAREAALRRTYEHELEREVAARREYELELENDLRREAGEAMRAELDVLRRELGAVADLRAEVARVAELRDDVSALSALREEVARVGALREDVLALTALRSEIGQVGELRAELGRLRVELTEQLSSEMLVERIVMRTQAGRLTGSDVPRSEAPAGWQDDAPRQLTGGWPAVRLDEQTGTQQYERVRVDRTPPPHPWQTVPRVPDAAAPPPPYTPPPVAPAAPAYVPPPVPQAPGSSQPAAWTPAPPATEGYGLGSGTSHRSRHAAPADDLEPASPPPSPREWLASRSLLDAPPTQAARYDAPYGEQRYDEQRYDDQRYDQQRYDQHRYGDVAGPATGERPSPFPRRRRSDDPPPTPTAGPDDLLTTERPVAPRPTSAGQPPGPPGAPFTAAPADPPRGHDRLEQILSESGVRPGTGSRRRRRYRDEDGAEDDVLARVLRGD